MRVNAYPNRLANGSLAQGVIPCVLMQNRGDDELDQVVFVDRIRECVPVIPAISFGALAKLRVRVVRLCNASLTGYENETGVVQAIKRCSLEFLLDRLRRKLLICAHRAKIWNEKKNALGLSPLRKRVLIATSPSPSPTPGALQTLPGSAAALRRRGPRAEPHPHYRTIPPLDKQPSWAGLAPVSQGSSLRGEFRSALALLREHKTSQQQPKNKKQTISWRTSYKPFDSGSLSLGASYSYFAGSCSSPEPWTGGCWPAHYRAQSNCAHSR